MWGLEIPYGGEGEKGDFKIKRGSPNLSTSSAPPIRL